MPKKATLRADGRFVIKRIIDGKTKYYYGQSSEEAEDKARAAGAHNITNNDTLKTWIEYWLNNVMKPNIDDDTHSNYKTLIDKHITGEDGLGKKRLRDLTTQDIRQFLTKKLEKLSPNSVLKLHFFLKSSLLQASYDGVLLKSPAAPVKRPKLDPKKNKYLECDTVRKLIAEATRHKALLLLAWTSGLRREELLGLYWTDIVKGAVTVRRAVKKGKKISTDLKTKAAYRTIPLPAETIAALEEFRKGPDKKKKEKVVDLTTPLLIFRDEAGQPYEPLVITRFFSRLCERIGIDADLYDLRHTYATNLARSGVHPAKIQYLMGHARATMALEGYTHINVSHLDDISGIVGKAIEVKKTTSESSGKTEVVTEVVK